MIPAFRTSNSQAHYHDDTDSLRLLARRMPIQVYSLGVTIFFAVLFQWFVAYFNPHGFYDGWEPAQCPMSPQVSIQGCFCELDMNSQVKQPVNAFSAFSFVIVGIWVATFGTLPGDVNHGITLTDFLDPVEGYEAFSSSLGSFLVLRGVGSWIFHSSLTLVGQWGEALTSHLIGVSILLYLAYISFVIKSIRTYWYILVFVLIGFGLFEFFAPGYIFVSCIWYLLVIALIFYIYIQRKGHFSMNLLATAIFIQLLGFIGWLVDYMHVSGVCFSKSVFQGHAIWHLLFALSFVFIFLFLRSFRGAGMEELDQDQNPNPNDRKDSHSRSFEYKYSINQDQL